MKKAWAAGVVGCAALLAAGYALGGWSLARSLNVWAGVAALFAAVLSSGSLVSGDRMRANYHASSEADRRQRNRWTGWLLTFAAPFIAAAILLYITVN